MFFYFWLEGCYLNLRTDSHETASADLKLANVQLIIKDTPVQNTTRPSEADVGYTQHGMSERTVVNCKLFERLKQSCSALGCSFLIGRIRCAESQGVFG